MKERLSLQCSVFIMKRLAILVLCLCPCLSLRLLADEPKLPTGPYVNDLSSLPVGKLPDELYALAGAPKIAEADGNKFVEFPGTPLDAVGVLFGPEGHALLDVSVRISATSAGRLFPEIGIGANDAGGYRLWLMPGPQKLVLRKGEEDKTVVEYKDWKSGEWTNFRLRVTPAGPGQWKIEGKVWPDKAKEPEQWAVSFEETQAPQPGRASFWGVPYSETPIRFDDLKVTPLDAAAK
jgi:hypothetical protein